MTEKFEKCLAVVLKEMCKQVGADYKTMDFKTQEWFWKHSWTQEQEDDFVKWLAEYVSNDKDARNTLMEYPLKTNKATKEFAEEFAWNYGWRLWKIKEKK